MTSAHVALVVGNRDYREAAEIKNAARDAVKIGQILTELGYHNAEPRLDLDINALDDAVSTFKQAAAGAALGLVYYAGHSIQVDGINHLLSTDAVLATRKSLDRFGVRLDDLLGDLEAETTIVILDACRDDPFAGRAFAKEAANRSVAPAASTPAAPVLDGSRAAALLFATSPGKKAMDAYAMERGDSPHSPLAQALIDRLPAPGMTFGTLADRAIEFVREVTGGRQVPWWLTSLPRDLPVAPKPVGRVGRRPGAIAASTGAPINLAVPDKAPFAWVAQKIGEHIGRPVMLESFTAAEEGAALRAHKLHCSSPTDALMALSALAAPGKIRKYIVTDQNYNLVIRPLEDRSDD